MVAHHHRRHRRRQHNRQFGNEVLLVHAWPVFNFFPMRAYISYMLVLVNVLFLIALRKLT